VRKLRSFLTLGFREHMALVEAWLLLLGIDLALRWISVPGLQRILDRLPAWTAEPASLSPSRWAELVQIAARHHFLPMRCLHRSLALRFFLRQRGLDAELRFGVYKRQDRFHAHAWVEHAGRPIGETGEIERHFLPLHPPIAPR
jgi:hypothetical protein